MSRGNGGPAGWRFREFVLDSRRGGLFRSGEEIRLRPQSFRVLCYLVENRGRLLSKDELLDAVWGKRVVTEGSLTQCLIDIRRALGDQSRELVRTVPRRGYIFEAEVTEVVAEPTTEEPAVAPPAGRLRRAAIGAVVAVLVAFVAAWGFLAGYPPEEAVPAKTPSSVAVLPFEDMSESGDQAFLAHGIAEEIRNTLARSPDLRVVARASSFSLGQDNVDVATVGDLLGVAYVVDGSVRRAGERVRISAQLIDTSNRAHVWSSTFDRELTDLFNVQRDIAAAAAAALAATLSGTTPATPASAEAYELYLQGRFFHNRRAPGDSAMAERYYRRALSIDPNFGRGWAGLAGACMVQILEEGKDFAERRASWGQAVEQALEHAPDLAEAHVRAAQYYWHAGNDARATAHRERAMALEPDDPLALTSTAGVEASRGRIDVAVALYRRAIALDPLSAITHHNLSNLLAAAGEYDEAIAKARKTTNLSPSFALEVERDIGFFLILQNQPAQALRSVQRWPEGPDRDAAFAMIHHAQHRPAESDAALADLVGRAQANPDAFGVMRVAEVHAFRGEMDEAFRWLERGRELVRSGSRQERGQRIHDAWLSPFLARLRDDERWPSIVAWER